MLKNEASNNEWNLPISREEFEEIMELEETMRLVFEEEWEQEQREMKERQRISQRYCRSFSEMDNGDFPSDYYESEADYCY